MPTKNSPNSGSSTPPLLSSSSSRSSPSASMGKKASAVEMLTPSINSRSSLSTPSGDRNYVNVAENHQQTSKSSSDTIRRSVSNGTPPPYKLSRPLSREVSSPVTSLPFRFKSDSYGRPSIRLDLSKNPIVLPSISSFSGFPLPSFKQIQILVLCVLWYCSSAMSNNIGKQILQLRHVPVTLAYVQFAFVAIACCIVGQFATLM
jgi:hypothetical protein